MRHQRSATTVYVDQRIGSNHPLIHSIEGQGIALGRPECPFRDAKLPLMHRLPTDNALLLLVSDNRRIALGRKQKEVVAVGVGEVLVGRAEIEIAPSALQRVIRSHLLLLIVEMNLVRMTVEGQDRAVRILRERHLEGWQLTHCGQASLCECLVQLLTGEKHLLLSLRFGSPHAIALHIEIALSTPIELFQLFRHESAVILSAGNELLQRQLLILRRDRHGQ